MGLRLRRANSLCLRQEGTMARLDTFLRMEDTRCSSLMEGDNMRRFLFRKPEHMTKARMGNNMEGRIRHMILGMYYDNGCFIFAELSVVCSDPSTFPSTPAPIPTLPSQPMYSEHGHQQPRPGQYNYAAEL